MANSKDNQFRGFDSVHHGEWKPLREDAARSQLPWRAKIRMRRGEGNGCHHRLSKLISKPLLLLLVVGNLLEELVTRFLEKPNQYH